MSRSNIGILIPKSVGSPLLLGLLILEEDLLTRNTSDQLPLAKGRCGEVLHTAISVRFCNTRGATTVQQHSSRLTAAKIIMDQSRKSQLVKPKAVRDFIAQCSGKINVSDMKYGNTLPSALYAHFCFVSITLKYSNHKTI